jgi:hypothetical protein
MRVCGGLIEDVVAIAIAIGGMRLRMGAMVAQKDRIQISHLRIKKNVAWMLTEGKSRRRRRL